MVVIGASGHAKEILQILHDKDETKNLFFFDNIPDNKDKFLFDKYPIIKSFDELAKIFLQTPICALGIGGCETRHHMVQKLVKIGGRLSSIISGTALIGSYDIELGVGVNIMNNVFISNSVTIGEGSLLNYNCSIHHDVQIGSYCELSPGCKILGRAKIGDYCFIGAGAIILPKICIGSKVTIGAGAVVTKDIENNSVAVGVPAKVIKYIARP